MNVKNLLKFSLITILVLSIAACNTGHSDLGTDSFEGGQGTNFERQGPNQGTAQGERPDLEQKGEGQRPQGSSPIMLLDIASEATGLDVETIREQTANGATLAEIITANGGDVEAVKAQMIETMEGMSRLPDDGDVEQFVDNMLNNPLGQRNSGGRSP